MRRKPRVDLSSCVLEPIDLEQGIYRNVARFEYGCHRPGGAVHKAHNNKLPYRCEKLGLPLTFFCDDYKTYHTFVITAVVHSQFVWFVYNTSQGEG